MIERRDDRPENGPELTFDDPVWWYCALRFSGRLGGDDD